MLGRYRHMHTVAGANRVAHAGMNLAAMLEIELHRAVAAAIDDAVDGRGQAAIGKHHIVRLERGDQRAIGNVGEGGRVEIDALVADGEAPGARCGSLSTVIVPRLPSG